MRVGLDIGSTTIKCVVLDEQDTLLYSTYERHYSHILEKAQELLRRIDECRDFILILSEGALDRCVDPSAVASADWVRCELAYALEKNKNIVPIMLAGFTAFPDNLPDVELGGNATVAAD